MTGELGAQIAHAGSGEKKRGPGFQRETLWRYSVGAAGYSGRLWTYQTVPGFHLAFTYTLLWELEKGTITPQGAMAEHLIHWTRQSCSRSEAGWFKHPQRFQSQVVIHFMCLFSFCFVLFVCFLHTVLPAIYIFSFHRKSLPLPYSAAVPGSLWASPLPLCCLALSCLHRHPGWTAGSVLVPSFWNGCTPPRQMAVQTIFNCVWGRRFYNLF